MRLQGLYDAMALMLLNSIGQALDTKAHFTNSWLESAERINGIKTKQTHALKVQETAALFYFFTTGGRWQPLTKRVLF